MCGGGEERQGEPAPVGFPDGDNLTNLRLGLSLGLRWWTDEVDRLYLAIDCGMGTD